jgi:hypothetical protein
MKTFRDIILSTINEEAHYPGDDMTQKELKIAINAAKNILDMLEDGEPLQRWQISAIVKASDELASVCTSMQADAEEDDDMPYDHMMMPHMYGEETDYRVSIEGLPDLYVKGKSPSEVKASLRKVVKKPDMIQSVDRVTQAVIKKIFRDKAAGKEEIEEGYNDPIHRKYISDAVHEYVAKDDPKHDKIVDHLHKAKNFGTKTKDELEAVASISTGASIRITKAVADHLKANFGSPSKTQTQAQRVDRYLKQKWVKPR